MRIPPELQQLARTRGGVVTQRRATAVGVGRHVLSRLARQGVVARIAHGVYVVAASTRDAVEPWAATLGLFAVLSYESAVAWWGVELPRPVRRTHVTTPRNRGRRRDAVRGVRIHRANLRADEVTTLRGVPVTTPLRTALDVARHASLEDAVAIIDAFFRRRLLDPREFEQAVARALGPGRARMVRVAMLVDPESGSVLESLTRVLMWRHQLPAARSQFRIACPGWAARVDFAWPEHRVVLECDGYEWHGDRAGFERDRRRWSGLTRLGWRVAVVTWFDVTADPSYVVRLVRDLLTPAHIGAA